MFSPDPENQTLYVYARVVNTDGSTWIYWLPQLHKMDLVERYGKFRFGAYVETTRLDSSKALWPDLARWIASKDHEVTGKRAVRVLLCRTWWIIHPPPEDTSKPPMPQWHVYQFFELKVPAKPGRKLPVKYMPKTIIATK